MMPLQRLRAQRSHVWGCWRRAPEAAGGALSAAPFVPTSPRGSATGKANGGHSSQKCRAEVSPAGMGALAGARRTLRRRWKKSRPDEELATRKEDNPGTTRSCRAPGRKIRRRRASCCGCERKSGAKERNPKERSVVLRLRTKIRGEEVFSGGEKNSATRTATSQVDLLAGAQPPTPKTLPQHLCSSAGERRCGARGRRGSWAAYQNRHQGRFLLPGLRVTRDPGALEPGIRHVAKRWSNSASTLARFSGLSSTWYRDGSP